MVAVGMLLIWGGYSAGLWGWCLIRDYDVTFGQLVSPSHPYSGAWPPPPVPAGQTWPGGASAAQQQAAAGSAAAKPAAQPGVIEKIIKYLGTPRLP